MRVGQVITNFLTNAMKYAPQSKYILLKTQASDTDVILSVKDFGPGIPEELRKKIFDPFYRIEKTEMRERRQDWGWDYILPLRSSNARMVRSG